MKSIPMDRTPKINFDSLLLIAPNTVILNKFNVNKPLYR
jgi:hypothetical protein